MILGQLRDLIRVEAHLTDLDAWQVWIDQTIQSELNSLTALIRYPELREEATVNLTVATQLVTIPASQHIQYDEVYYVPDGNLDTAYLLEFGKHNMVVNAGRSETVLRKSPTAFSLFPYGEIATGDKIAFVYWKFPTLTDDQSVIPVELLVETLKQRVITRASLHGSSKNANLHRQLAKETYSMSLGATDMDELSP